MFLAAVLRLRQAAPAPLPPYLGRATHACFFELLGAAAPALADSLHDADRPKGFTVSDLLRPPGAADSLVREWRITSIDADLTGVLLAQVLPRLPAQVSIGGQL